MLDLHKLRFRWMTRPIHLSPVKAGKKRKPKQLVNLMLDMRKNGAKVAEICEALHVSHSTVVKYTSSLYGRVRNLEHDLHEIRVKSEKPPEISGTLSLMVTRIEMLHDQHLQAVLDKTDG